MQSPQLRVPMNLQHKQSLVAVSRLRMYQERRDSPDFK